MDKVTSITIARPDDWHVHVRDGDLMRAVLPFTSRTFSRAIIMPNLSTPITSIALASEYKKQIIAALPEDAQFMPLMTHYLNAQSDVDDITSGFQKGVYSAVKYYPSGATTNSHFGVSDIKSAYPVLEAMQKIGMPLLVHGEIVDDSIDVFDKEAVFIDKIMTQIVNDFPELRIVFEHITTQEAVDFVREQSENIAATITPQHLMLNRNAMFNKGIRPHMYCLPIVKREKHKLALRKAATSGSSKYFLGTDSAPHIVGRKENDCGCAGIFNAPYALECYTQVFDEEKSLDQLEQFTSINGANFYQLPVNKNRVTLEKRAVDQIEYLSVSESDKVKIFAPDDGIQWAVVAS